jgi:hypothetical protein
MQQTSYEFEQKREEFNQRVASGLKYPTLAGHLVQSRGEKFIADVLYQAGISYMYDALVKVNNQWIRPDFILPTRQNLMIEYKGMDTPEYNEMFFRKLEIIRAGGVRVMILTPLTMNRLKELL